MAGIPLAGQRVTVTVEGGAVEVEGDGSTTVVVPFVEGETAVVAVLHDGEVLHEDETTRDCENPAVLGSSLECSEGGLLVDLSNEGDGDAVVAAFGIPVLHEDDALRAVRAAVEMREAMARLNRQIQVGYGVTLVTRIGVHTGARATRATRRSDGDVVLALEDGRGQRAVWITTDLIGFRASVSDSLLERITQRRRFKAPPERD